MRTVYQFLVSLSGVLALTVGAYFALTFSQRSAAAAGGGHERLVQSEDLTNCTGSQLTAVVVNYAPGAKSSSHHHSGSVFAYVLSGSIRSQNSATGPVKVYAAGESFFEPVGSEHLISENASDSQPASMLAVFVAPRGSQLTTASH